MSSTVADDYDTRYFARITPGVGKFGDYDTVFTTGPATHLMSGPLATSGGYAVPSGEQGELFSFHNPSGGTTNVPYIPAGSGDNRGIWRCHDPLPWATAIFEGGALLSACRAVSTYGLTPGNNMPPIGWVPPGGWLGTADPFQFAHKGDRAGWAYTIGGGNDGHFGNLFESALRMSRTTERAGFVLDGWMVKMRQPYLYGAVLYDNIAAAYAATAIITGEDSRECQAHMVHCYMVYKATGIDSWRVSAEDIADRVMATPLQNNGAKLSPPMLPYYLWKIRGPAAAAWIAAAVAWQESNNAYGRAISQPWARSGSMALFAVHFFITGDIGPLQRALPSLPHIRDHYYRKRDSIYDWVGICPGRTGEMLTSQWPLVKRAMIAGGLTDADVPPYTVLNFLPTNRPSGFSGLIDIKCVTGTMQTGIARFTNDAGGGDTDGGTLYKGCDIVAPYEHRYIVPTTPPQAFASYYGEENFTLVGPTTCITAVAYQNILGPLTANPTEYCDILAATEYEIGPCRAYFTPSANGTLSFVGGDTTGSTNQTPPRVAQFLCLFDINGDPIDKAVWDGKPEDDFTLPLVSGVPLYIEARGQFNNRATMTSSVTGQWRALRPTD